MNEDFINMANTMKNECLLKTEALFVANKKSWFEAFAMHFERVCAEIQKLQKESALPPISYLEYTMLYTNFVNRQYLSEVIVYGDEYCLDTEQRVVGAYDISFLFVYFDELWDRLVSARKKYAGKVTSQDVKAYMLESVLDFYSYFTSVVRFSVADLTDKEPFVGVSKNDIFMLTVGEYMAKTESVFTQKNNRNVNELIDWFLEELDDVYMCGDYSGLDLSEKNFSYNNYCYSNFRNAYLDNATLEGAMLIGSSFRGAKMEGCRFDRASIYEADFSNACLKNASFVKVRGKAGLTNESVWCHAGFLPVNFLNADLTGADFSGADLTGADFSGANTTDAVFLGAVLDNAVFDVDSALLAKE